MTYLALVFPALKNRRLPLTRDQLMLLMAAFNEIMLGVDTYLAHVLNQTILWREWIPIIFGPLAGGLLLIAGLVALRNRLLAARLATLVFLASIVVGVLGASFHLIRGILPTAPVGSRVTIPLLIWAPPILAPFAFAGIGVLGMSAAFRETPPDSGTLEVGRTRRLHMPYSKTRAYLFLISLGILATLLSSAFDHGRTGYTNPWLWAPIIVGVFATAVSAGLGAIRQPNKGDILTYLVAMGLLILAGIVGGLLHVQTDLAGESVIVPERFLRGAPFLAPLLFANMGLLGIIALLSPVETPASD